MNFQNALPQTSTMRLTGQKIAEMQQQLTRWREELADLRKAQEMAGEAIKAARTAQAVETAAGSGSSGGGLLGVFARVGSWFGLEGVAATLAGGVLMTAVLGGVTYQVARFAGSRAGDEPVRAGTATHRPPNTNQSSTPIPATVMGRWTYRDYDPKAGKDKPNGYTTTFEIFKDGTAKAADGGTGNVISYTDNEIKIQASNRSYKYTITWDPRTAIGQILFSGAPHDSPKYKNKGPYNISMRRS